MMEQKRVQPRLTKRLIFRISEEDYQRFQEVVKNYKVKQAEFLRQLTLLGLDSVENSLRLKLLKELIKEVHRIGVNLNQIARWVNTYKDKADARVVLDRLRFLIYRVELKELIAYSEKLFNQSGS